MKTLLALSGSNSSTSVNKQLLLWAVTQVEAHEINFIDIRDFEMPIFSEDLEKSDGHPKNAIKLRDLISQADAFMVASPEHNGMIPAALKNTFDWLSRVGPEEEKGIFNNKPVCLLSASPGPRGGKSNLQNMANVMPFWGADIKGQYSVGSFYQEFADGQPSKEHAKNLTALVKEFSKSN